MPHWKFQGAKVPKTRALSQLILADLWISNIVDERNRGLQRDACSCRLELAFPP